SPTPAPRSLTVQLLRPARRLFLPLRDRSPAGSLFARTPRPAPDSRPSPSAISTIQTGNVHASAAFAIPRFQTCSIFFDLIRVERSAQPLGVLTGPLHQPARRRVVVQRLHELPPEACLVIHHATWRAAQPAAQIPDRRAQVRLGNQPALLQA